MTIIAQILDREATTLFLENLVEHALRVGKFGQSRSRRASKADGHIPSKDDPRRAKGNERMVALRR